MTERERMKIYSNDDQISIYNGRDRAAQPQYLCPFRISNFIFTSHGHFISKCETISSNVNIITHKMIVELSANNFAITLNQIERTNIQFYAQG